MPTQISPNGKAFRTNSWSDLLQLPSHYKNEDGTQGAAIDWSGVTFTVEPTGLPAGVTMDLSVDRSGAAPLVTMSLDEAATSALSIYNRFRWYLRAEPGFGVIFFRIVAVSGEQP